MPTNFEKTENHVAQSLRSQPDSTKALSQELQIVENEKTHDFELRKMDDAKNSGVPDKTAPDRGTERE